MTGKRRDRETSSTAFGISLGTSSYLAACAILDELGLITVHSAAYLAASVWLALAIRLDSSEGVTW